MATTAHPRLGRPGARGGVPGAAAVARRGRGAGRGQHAGRRGAPARPLEPLPGRPGGRPPLQADPARLPRLPPPHRAGPRRRPRPGRGAGGRAAEGGRLPLGVAARRRRHDRCDGDLGRGLGARRRHGPRSRSASAARTSTSRSAAATSAPWLPAGRLCVADAEGAVAVLFGAPGQASPVATRTAHPCSPSRSRGVPDIHVSEALWTVADTLAGWDYAATTNNAGCAWW